MEPQALLYTGTDDTAGVEYLLTVWPDGTREIAQRPQGSPHSWGPPAPVRCIGLLAVSR